MIDDLILRIPNIERKCAITLVSDAQNCPLERVGGEVNWGRASQKALHNDHIAWQGHTTITECMQPPVSQLPGLLFCAYAPRISRVEHCGIQASDSLDGYVADGNLACPAYCTRLYIRSTG